MRNTRNDILLAMVLALFGCQREPAPAGLALRQQPRVEAEAELPTRVEGEAADGGPTAASNSRLRIETWDFGIIPPRSELRHRYTIKNGSAATWTIKHVTPSCTCTCGEFTSRTIKPSESASLEVVYRAGDRDGDVYQAIMVEFAETNAPFFQLALRGEIRGLLSPSPPSVDFGRVWAAKHLSRSIHLRNFGEQDVTITRIDTPPWLQAQAQPVDSGQAGSQPRQTWEITANADVSKFKAADVSALVVHTNASKIGPVVIPVHLEMRLPLEVVPNGLDFRIVPMGGSSQRTLMLDVSPELGDASEKDLVLTHNLGEELEIQVSKTATQSRFRLVGVLRPRRSTGAVHGELEIKVREKTAPAVRVPVSAFVR
jgi:hypothetical protein